MDSIAAKQARAKSAVPASLTHPDHSGMERPPRALGASPEPKAAGYGLPCSSCRAYYPADLDVCPICKSQERVSAQAVPALPVAPLAAPAAPGVGEEDREQFLKELKSQAFASHTQINPAATFRCVLEENHTEEFEPAAVCHSCYGDVRQQADRLEACLHMDVKEAAQIVYTAVWADTSDPSRTYINAAAALLGELRRRAGVGLLLGSNQPLSH